jgi:predicted nucleotidyltransferase component of viral defense system
MADLNPLQAALAAVARHLGHHGKRCALVGGLAVSARTEPRFTRDLDLAVAVADDREAEQLVRGLVQVGYVPVTLVEQDAKGRLATARLAAPSARGARITVDLLFASSGIEHEIVTEADVLEVFPGVHVGVASVHHLLAMKVLSRDDRRRPQDLVDLMALVRAASAKQIEAATGALRLIQARGFGRGKDLVDELLDAVRLARDGSDVRGTDAG